MKRWRCLAAEVADKAGSVTSFATLSLSGLARLDALVAISTTVRGRSGVCGGSGSGGRGRSASVTGVVACIIAGIVAGIVASVVAGVVTGTVVTASSIAVALANGELGAVILGATSVDY